MISITWIVSFNSQTNQITMIMFNNHITMANDNNHIIMSNAQCQPPIRQFSQQSVIVPKMAAAQVFAKNNGFNVWMCDKSMQNTKQCKQNSSKGALAKCILRWKMFTQVAKKLKDRRQRQTLEEIFKKVTM